MDSSEKSSLVQKRKSSGRKKIPMALIAKKNNRDVTFSKRKKGLFKKAAELATLCGAHVTIVVQSEAGKNFSFGDPKTLLDRLPICGEDHHEPGSLGLDGSFDSQDCGLEQDHDWGWFEQELGLLLDSFSTEQDQDFDSYCL